MGQSFEDEGDPTRLARLAALAYGHRFSAGRLLVHVHLSTFLVQALGGIRQVVFTGYPIYGDARLA